MLISTSVSSPLHGRYTCCSSTGIAFVSAGRWEGPDAAGGSLSPRQSSELSNSPSFPRVIGEGAMQSRSAMLAAFCKCVKVIMWDARASLSRSTDCVSEMCGDLPSRRTLSRNSILVHINGCCGMWKVRQYNSLHLFKNDRKINPLLHHRLNQC